MKTFLSILIAGSTLFLTTALWADLPDLVPVDFQVPATITAAPYPTVQVAWAVTNQGNAEARGYWSDILYLSTQPFYDSSAGFVAYTDAPSPVEPGEVYWSTNTVALPITDSGTYYLILYANAYNYLQESDTSNNTIVRPVNFVSTPADLAALNLVVPSNVTGPPNPYVTIAYAVTNLGPGTASGGWWDALYVSTNPVPDLTANQIVNQYEVSSVPAGGRYWRTNTVRLPVVTSGTYYLILQADTRNSLYETNTDNNVMSVAVNFDIRPPDLAPLALLVPSAITGAPNSMLTFVWGVTNQGAGAAIGNSSWFDGVFLSTDPVWDPSDQLLVGENETGPIQPRGRYWRTNIVSLPAITSGTWYLIFKTDAYDSIHDLNPANNVISVPVAFTIVRPDLVPLAQAPAVINGPPYPPVTFAFGATNQGAGAAIGTWGDFVYFSTDATIDFNDPAFSFYQFANLPPGSSYWQTNTFRLPATNDGTYYFIFQADRWSSLSESDTNNNILTVPVTIHIQPPDLAPIALQLPTVVTCPPNPEITFVWGITNQGIGPAIGNYSWSDLIYISTNAVWDTTATVLNNDYENGPVAPGTDYWRTNTLRLPIVHSGTYYFTLKADANNQLIESNEDNNFVTVPATFIVQSPDLAPLVSQTLSPFIGPPNPRLTLVWGVTNQGPGLARGYWDGWYDAVYFSSNSVLDSQAVNISGWLGGGPLVAGGSYWWTNSVIVPVTRSGAYYLIFETDISNSIYEDNKSNNVLVVPVSFVVLPPDLAPLALQVPAVITGPPNPPATLVWGVTNQGIGPAVMGDSYWSDGVYLSRNAFLDASDPGLVWSLESGPVAPGGSYWRTNSLRIPVFQSTNLYLIFKADTENSIVESDESNNTLAVPVRFDILPPDLAPVAFLVTNNFIGAPNPTLTFIWGVTNQGTGIAENDNNWSWGDQVYISTNSVFDSTATYVASVREPGPLAAGSSYWRTNQFRLPLVQSGTYYLFFTTDADRSVHESNFANNTVSQSISLTILPPDLAVLALQVSHTITGPPRPSVTLSWGVTNQGVGATGDSWWDNLYLSSTPVLDYTAVQLGQWSESGPLAAGGTYWRTNTVTLPVTQDGDYYLIFQTDYANWLSESDLDNNSVSVPVTLNILPPDLSPVSLLVPNVVTGPPNPSVTIVWGVTNQGPGMAVGNWAWSDQLFLCTGPGPDNGCAQFGYFWESGPIPAGGSYWRTNTVRVPVLQSGTYYLRFKADADGSLYESSFDNNEIVVPVTFQIQRPDLAPVLFQAPAIVNGAPFPQVRLVWGVTNQGAGLALGNSQWSDYVYLSTNSVLDFFSQEVASTSQAGPITPGGNYWYSQMVNLPVTQSGAYYLILSVDADRTTYDSNYSNNTAVVPIGFNISLPDLAPIAFLAPQTITAGANPSVTFTWGVTNQGAGEAATPYYWNWCDEVYLSTDPVLDSPDQPLLSSCYFDPVPPGGSYWRTNVAQIPVAQSGNYYLIFKTDANDVLLESDETNNTVVLPVSITIVPPDLAPTAVQAPALVTGPPNSTFTLIYAVTNLGGGNLSQGDYWQDAIYISRTNLPDGTEQYVDLFPQAGPLTSGGSYWSTNLVRVPVTEDGTWYLLIETDAGNSLREANTNNNIVAIPVTFAIQPSDVTPFGVQAPRQIAGVPYQPVTLVWGITNQGPGTAVGGWGWQHGIFLSTEPVFSNALYVTSFYETNTLPAGGVLWLTNTVSLPFTTNGQYYVCLVANLYNWLYELETNNDVAVVPITYTMELPDLAPIAFQAPAAYTSPPPPILNLVWGITNQGRGAAPGSSLWGSPRMDALWVSSSTNLDPGSATFVQSWSETNSLDAGGSYWRTNTVRLPVFQSGSYYLILTVNYSEVISELDTTNNTAILPITLNITPPDLAPLAFQAPALVTGQPNPEITLVWGVTNQGIGPAVPPPGQSPPLHPPPFASFGDGVYLSATPTLDGLWAQPFLLMDRNAPVLPGTSYWQTNRVRVPVANSGTYYLIFKTDANNVVMESNEGNNMLAVPVTFRLTPPGDLAAVQFIAPPTVNGSGNPTVTLAWQVENLGPGPITDTWMDQVSISGGSLPFYPLGSFWETHSLPAGASYWRTNTLIMPVTESGTYQLTFSAGQGGFFAGGYGPYDLDFQNNTLTVPIYFNLTGPPTVRFSTTQLFLGRVFMMSVYGGLGDHYRLEASTDLRNWTRVMDFVCLNDPTTVADYEAQRFGQRFYRIAPVSDSPSLRLDLQPSLPVFGPGMGTNWLGLKVDGPLGLNCQIESSTDLIDWQTTTNFQILTAPAYVPEPPAQAQRLFYRAIGTP